MLTTRQDLKEYCLRALGAPVVNINVDDEQLEDRIDEALEYWRLYHPEGIEQLYAKYIITASTLTLTTSNASLFGDRTTVTGATSGAKAIVLKDEGTSPEARKSTGNTLLVIDIIGDFLPGETISNGTVSGTLATMNYVVKGMYDNKYVTLPDLVYGVTRVIPMSQASSSKNMFDLQYQLRLHDL